MPRIAMNWYSWYAWTHDIHDIHGLFGQNKKKNSHFRNLYLQKKNQWILRPPHWNKLVEKKQKNIKAQEHNPVSHVNLLQRPQRRGPPPAFAVWNILPALEFQLSSHPGLVVHQGVHSKSNEEIRLKLLKYLGDGGFPVKITGLALIFRRILLQKSCWRSQRVRSKRPRPFHWWKFHLLLLSIAQSRDPPMANHWI